MNEEKEKEDRNAFALGPSAEEIMTWDLQTVEMNTGTTVRQAAQLMMHAGHGCIIVTKGTNAVGIVTERDIVHKITAEGIDPSKVLIEDVMTTPLVTIGRKARAKEVAEKMSALEIRRIVVVDESGMLVGLITTGDFAKWFARQRNFMDPMLNAIARVKATKETSTGPYV